MIAQTRHRACRALGGHFDNLNHVAAYGESYFLLSMVTFLAFAGIAGYVFFSAPPMKLDMGLCASISAEFPSLSCAEGEVERLRDLREKLAVLLRPDIGSAASPFTFILMFVFLFAALLSVIMFRFSGAIEANNRRKFAENVDHMGYTVVEKDRFEEMMEALVERAELKLKQALAPALPKELPEPANDTRKTAKTNENEALETESDDEVSLSRKDQRFLDRLNEAMRQGYANSNFLVADLARETGVSKGTLTSSMQRLLGCTPAEYMKSYRMGVAKELLLQDEGLTIADISRLVGYADVQSFRKRFGEIYGVSPSQFRK